MMRRHGGILCAASLFALASGAARADTSILGYGGPGNELNPWGQPLDLMRDPDGLSQLDDITRTPTGLLYPLPYAYPAMNQSKDNPDIWSTGWIQGGVIGSFGQHSNSAALREYGDWHTAPLGTSLGFLKENRRTAWFMSGLAENIGRSDQYYEARTGRYGVFNFTAFFDSIPHIFSTEAKSLWNGVGSNNLTLRGGLVPGQSTVAQVEATLAGAPQSDLQVTREKAGFSASYTPWTTLEGFFRITNEWKDGTQPISATFGYPFENGAMQLIDPIHYRTLDVSTGVRYKTDDLQANLTYSGSFFRNSDPSLTWQNPGLEQVPTGSYIPTEGRLSLPPNNNYNTVKGDLTAIVSPDIRFSASLSYSMMRQNDQLLAPTIDSGIIQGAGGPINLDNWNTTAALSRQTADAAINLFNAFARLQYVYSPDLTFDFEMRDHNEWNLTNYLSYNPLTGQYGYIVADGGVAPFSPLLTGVYQSGVPGDIVQIRNMPFANDDLKITARASYRFDNHLKADLSYVHDSVEHSVREMSNGQDNRVQMQIATTGYSWGSLRASYQFGHLRGSDYTSDPYLAYFSQSLPGYVPLTPQGDIPFTLNDLRMFDIADRIEHIGHVQGNYIVTPQIDLQVSSDIKVDDYDAPFGLRASNSFDLNTDVNYQIATTATVTGFFTWQMQHRSIANDNAQGQPGSGYFGGPDYPIGAAWNEALADHDYAAGLTVHKAWNKVSIDLNYIYTHGVSGIGYKYTSPQAFFYLLTPAQAGTAFPDITYDSHSIETDVRWQAEESLSYRLVYRVDFERLDDFHYDGLFPGVIENNIYLGVAPENFTVQTVGLLVQYTF